MTADRCVPSKQDLFSDPGTGDFSGVELVVNGGMSQI